LVRVECRLAKRSARVRDSPKAISIPIIGIEITFAADWSWGARI
jgi:hypothetical protein